MLDGPNERQHHSIDACVSGASFNELPVSGAISDGDVRQHMENRIERLDIHEVMGGYNSKVFLDPCEQRRLAIRVDLENGLDLSFSGKVRTHIK